MPVHRAWFVGIPIPRPPSMAPNTDECGYPAVPDTSAYVLRCGGAVRMLNRSHIQAVDDEPCTVPDAP
jgi:hypothetical protein